MASMNFAWSSAVRAEPGEPLACWLDKHARVQGGGRESPGMRVTFFCFAKRKSPKKRRPPVCDPFAERRGKPASCRLRGAPWNSLRCVAASFRHPRRVSSRSTRAPTRVPPRNRPAAGAASRGLDSLTSTRAIAALGPACAARSACAPRGPSAAMARVLFHPLLAAPAAGRLWGGHARRSAHASSTDSPGLSERSCAAAQ